MKIIAYSYIYNEIRLLPLNYYWLKSQGIELYVVNNLSSDGTKEFLVKNNIRHHDIDTKGAFDLRPLLAEVEKQIHIDRPDWIMLMSADMFFSHSDLSITELIQSVNETPFNILSAHQYTFYHTSPSAEPGNIFENYFFRYNGKYDFIARYDNGITITPDRINQSSFNKQLPENLSIFEMNVAKPIEERIQNYIRRQKAWTHGLNKSLGSHYRSLAEKNFVFPESQQEDVRNSSLYKAYCKLQKFEQEINTLKNKT